MTIPPDPTSPGSSELEQEVAELRRRAREVQEQVGRIQGQSHAANGAVSVTVDARGRLQKLRLTPQALRLTPDALADAIVDGVRQAEQQADRAVAETTKPFTDRPEIRDAMAALHEFGADLPGEQSNPAVTSRTTDEFDDDLHFEQFHEDPLGRHRE